MYYKKLFYFVHLLAKVTLLPLLLLPSFILCSNDKNNNENQNNVTASSPRRIISLAPGITETLFALGIGERVVGVTNYCVYPPEAKEIPPVGAFFDPNYEAILQSNPDMVILMREQLSVLDFLKKKKIPYCAIDDHNLSAIMSSIRQIGTACGRGDTAEKLVENMESEIKKEQYEATVRPNVMIVVDRNDIGSGRITKAWLAGPNTFYHDLLSAAHADNVIKSSKFDYPALSVEGIVHLRPDIIIEIFTGVHNFTPEIMKKDWGKIKRLKAVQQGTIFYILKDYASVPGPRVVNLLRDFRQIIAQYENENKERPCGTRL